MSDIDLVIYNASELVGKRNGSFQAIDDAGLAVVNGEIAKVGSREEVLKSYPAENAEKKIDASGKTVVPGFVDAHTHALFAGDRSDEFEAKLKGKTYQQILEDGGGILRTVEATREASNKELLQGLLDHLDIMLSQGTTTVEIKTGYGLDTDTELRMLEVMKHADQKHPVDVIPTFMGAHAVPRGMRTDDYVQKVVDEQIPAVENQGIAEFCDVFCEEGVFDVEQSRAILEAGKKAGMTPKIHAEEFSRIGGARLAADIGAASADHLLNAEKEDLDALDRAGTTPVLLPGTAFGLGEDYENEALFQDKNLDIALGTDFNPNCYSRSMSFAVTLACVSLGINPIRALRAATENSAKSVNRDNIGVLKEGYAADILVLDAPSQRYIPYNFDTSNVESVVKGGDIVV